MLVNKTATMQIIKIVTKDGKRDSINLQPNGRAAPPDGATIDPRMYAAYTKVLGGIEAYAPPQPADAQ